MLQTIHRNVNIADDEKNLVCQDTGIAVYTCRVGEHFPLHPTRIYEALRDGTARATVEHPLRSNAVHTITRENTGPNIGYRLPIVHWEFIDDWDGLDVKCVPKGSGSENMSFLKMCVPADGVKGIKQFVLESIVGAGGKPCPPGIVGVGIGGTADYAMYLAKEAITRPVGTRNSDPLVAELEEELYGLLNETGIGPMGLGGDVTVLQCHIEHADTHMTLNPVAVNYQCWAARRASVHVDAQTATSSTTGSSDGAAHVTFPITDPQEILKLRAGDEVTVQGHIIGIRDRTQIRIFDQGVEPPMDLSGAFLLHTAPGVRKLDNGKYEKVCIGTTTSARMVRFTEPLGRAVRRPRDLRQGRLPGRGDRADAAARDGLLRDRRRRRRARDDPDRGDRGGALGGADARVPLEVPRQGLRPAHRRHRRPRQLALPRRPGERPGEAEGDLCPALISGLPERAAGLTHVIDKGLGPRGWEDVLEVSGH